MVTLYDSSGIPISLSSLTAPSMQFEVIPSSYRTVGLTPQRLAALLKNTLTSTLVPYLELAEEMEEKYPHYLAVLNTRKRAVTQLSLEVMPADDSDHAHQQVSFVRDWLEQDILRDSLIDILDALGKGFSVTEIIWQTSETYWYPQSLKWRDPRHFCFLSDGQTLARCTSKGDPHRLSPYKFIIHHARAKSGLPIRGGLARIAAWSYLFANYGLKDWITFAEAYGQPLRLGRYHRGASEDDRSMLLRAVRDIGTDAAAIIPDSMRIEFQEAHRTASAELYEHLLVYLDHQVSKAVLGQTLTTDGGQGGSGSYALGRVHEGVRADIERSDAKQLATTVNRDLIRPMIDLNFGPQTRYPRVIIGRPEDVDIKTLTQALKVLVPLGLKVNAHEIRDKLGIGHPCAEEELLGSQDKSGSKD